MKSTPLRRLLRIRPGQRSLVRQAVTGIVLAELLCMLVMATVSIAHERRARLNALDIVLQGRADSVFGAVQDAEDAGDNVQLDPREMQIPAEDLFSVYDQSGRWLGGSSGVPEPVRSDRRDRQVQRHNQQWDGHTYRVLSRPNLRVIDRAETKGAGLERPVTIVYAMPLDHIWREVFEGIGFFLGASLLLTLGTMIFIVTMMRRVLQPIEELAAAATAVSPRELLFQAPEHALATKELRPLALAISAMLGELRLAFERQHQFLGDAAHELKTAVAVVRSSLQLLLMRRRLPEAYEAGIRVIVQDNARAEQLIARMLLMARLEETTQKPQVAHADLASIVQASLKRLEPLAEHAGVLLLQDESLTSEPSHGSLLASVEKRLIAGTISVPVSSDDLEVLVSNLLVNAIEHSASGSFVTTAITQEQSRAIFRVTDKGEGIPEEAQEHIFERFFRVDRSRARVTGGAGLGLSITKAIVDAASGTIAVFSRIGEGTTITVSLPCISAEVQPEEALADAEELSPRERF